jgi:hypothetical protein
MLQLCSWVLAVEGIQLLQLLSADSDHLPGASTRPATADSVAAYSVAAQDSMGCHSGSSARCQHAGSTSGVPGTGSATSSSTSCYTSSQPAGVSGRPVPCSSVQHAEGLLLHNADVLTAVLNSTAPSSVGSASQQHVKAVAAAGPALAGPSQQLHPADVQHRIAGPSRIPHCR